jgi:hypothetical protein
MNDVKEEVLWLLDLALKAKTIEEKNSYLELIKDLTKNNLTNM